jgi:hypothetical protein
LALLAGARGAQTPFPNSDSELEQRTFGDPWASINTPILSRKKRRSATRAVRRTWASAECGGSKLDWPVALGVKALHTARFRRYLRRSYPSGTIRYVAAESHLDSHLSPGISFISPPYSQDATAAVAGAHFFQLHGQEAPPGKMVANVAYSSLAP